MDDAAAILTANIARQEAKRARAIESNNFDEARRIEWFIDDIRAELQRVRDA